MLVLQRRLCWLLCKAHLSTVNSTEAQGPEVCALLPLLVHREKFFLI